MHFHVLGVGSVGCLLAHNLRRILPSTHTISLLLSPRSPFQKDCTIKVDSFGSTTTSNGYLVETSKEPQKKRSQDFEPIQSLFVTLKAQFTVDALRSLTNRLSANSTIVLMQNGMGLYEELIRDVFRNSSQRPHFIQASNTNGVFTVQPFHVVHAGIGSIDFGIVPDSKGREFEAGFDDDSIPYSQRRLRLSDITTPTDVNFARYISLRDTVAALLLLEPLNISWKRYAEIQLTLRRKLAVNAVINPLTSVMGCRNGQLNRLPPRARIVQNICQETSSIFAAEMRHETARWLEDMRARGVDATNMALPSLPKSLSPYSLEAEVDRVVELTKDNISSMLQDVRRGRRTEMAYINGYLVKLGLDHGIWTPYNLALRDLIYLRERIPLDQL